jgi:hypothetical protein
MKKEKGASKPNFIRICVLGASFCGKSTLCNRFVNNNFEWAYEPTVEVGIFRKLINLTQDEEHKQYCMMQIEDSFPINHPYLQMPRGTNPEIDSMMVYYDLVLGNKRSEKKKSNEKPLYKEIVVSGYMYVFDLTSLASFEEIVKVIEYIHIREEKEAGKKKGMAAKILVGTKKEMVGAQPVVTQAQLDMVKKKYNVLTRKVSAVLNSEVKEAFFDLARDAIDLNMGGEGHDSESDDEGGGFWNFLGCGDRKEGSSCVSW